MQPQDVMGSLMHLHAATARPAEAGLLRQTGKDRGTDKSVFCSERASLYSYS
jgi:hypothetical protein